MHIHTFYVFNSPLDIIIAFFNKYVGILKEKTVLVRYVLKDSKKSVNSGSQKIENC